MATSGQVLRIMILTVQEEQVLVLWKGRFQLPAVLRNDNHILLYFLLIKK